MILLLRTVPVQIFRNPSNIINTHPEAMGYAAFAENLRNGTLRFRCSVKPHGAWFLVQGIGVFLALYDPNAKAVALWVGRVTRSGYCLTILELFCPLRSLSSRPGSPLISVKINGGCVASMRRGPPGGYSGKISSKEGFGGVGILHWSRPLGPGEQAARLTSNSVDCGQSCDATQRDILFESPE
jgi:hypothetical protein